MMSYLVWSIRFQITLSGGSSLALKQGQVVSVRIDPVCSDSLVCPDRFTVRYSSDGGRPVIVDFKNSPGGI